ncbi:MAG: SEC-C domain-containing protein [Planctomycetes bacterium]|nr:SEC-C domain-containing protein [Planctomycetota bacterium]
METFERDSVEGWIHDFIESTPFRPFRAQPALDAAPILMAFMEAACASVSPGDLDEPAVKAGLLSGVAKLALPPEVRAAAPRLAGAFLEFLESEGRLSGGRELGSYAAFLAGAFEKEAKPEGTPFKKPGAPLGRNDPCPCGSGKKYKKCCG